MPGARLEADLWINEYISPHDVYQHGVLRVLAQRQTPFQDMAVVDAGTYGKALVLDGKWQTCTGDEFLYHEPLVHAPCTLHGRPRRVLIAGGADGGALREVLKWKSVERAVVCDIDGDVIAACRDLLPEVHQGAFDDPRAEIVVGDAFEYLARTPGHWDVIIADLTDPIEEGPAYKLFCREFFELVQAALAPGGVFVNQAGSISPPLVGLLTRVASTIRAVFTHVRVMQANVPTYGSPWGLAIARREPLPTRVDVVATDALLAARLTGTTRLFDGHEYARLLRTPKYVELLLEAEKVVYTVDAPPQFFGRTR